MALLTEQKIMQEAAKEISNVIEGYGNSVIIKRYGTKTYNDFGEVEYTNPTEFNEVAVSDSYFKSILRLTSAGRLKDSSVTLLFRPNTDLQDNDVVVYNGDEYRIIQITDLTTADVSLPLQVELGLK